MKIAEIVSKVIVLARDEQIKDSILLEQVLSRPILRGLQNAGSLEESWSNDSWNVKIIYTHDHFPKASCGIGNFLHSQSVQYIHSLVQLRHCSYRWSAQLPPNTSLVRS